MNILKNHKIENTYIMHFDTLSEYFAISSYLDKHEILWSVNSFSLTNDCASIIIDEVELDKFYNL